MGREWLRGGTGTRGCFWRLQTVEKFCRRMLRVAVYQPAGTLTGYLEETHDVFRQHS